MLGVSQPSLSNRPVVRLAQIFSDLEDSVEPTHPIATVNTATEFGLALSATGTMPSGLRRSRFPVKGARAIIGSDSRTPVTSSDYPWSAIGQVYGVTPEGDEYHCTGTLIMDDVVLTNAHCAVDPVTHELSDRIWFLPNLVNGEVQNKADIAEVIEIFYGTDFTDLAEPPHPNDWAFLRLDRPLGQQYGTLGLDPIPTAELADRYEGRLVMVGYSGDYPSDNPGATASAHMGCSIVDEVEIEAAVNAPVLLHECDTYGGSSGGPILGLVEGEYRIVALNSADLRDATTNEGIVNYAVQITHILDQIGE